MTLENRVIASSEVEGEIAMPAAMYGVSGYMRHKATIDLIIGALLLALLWPVIVLLMALVKFTSRGPALYRQVRLGLGGRRFVIYKLRTMVHDCERSTGPRWARPDDPWATPLGRVLRRTHLDELPQLWNVVRGEMSLIGPRPERPEIAHPLGQVVPGFEDRTRVRPGVTGLAQIQLPADSDVGGVRRKLAYDLYYTRAMGPWLDLRILLGTVLKVLGMRFEAIRRVLLLPEVDVILGDHVDPAAEYDQTTLPQLVKALS